MKIVNYDPYRQHWEKRIGRYFSWLWRAGQQNNKEANTVKVSTLLGVIGEEKRTPSETRQALENALEVLEKDRVIDLWNYEPELQEDQMTGKGWFDVYMQSTIVVFAPETILDAYSQIKAKSKKKLITNKAKDAKKNSARLETTAERLKRVVQLQKITTRQAADLIGISKDTVNRIINGAKPTKKAAEKIEKWLLSQNFETT